MTRDSQSYWEQAWKTLVGRLCYNCSEGLCYTGGAPRTVDGAGINKANCRISLYNDYHSPTAGSRLSLKFRPQITLLYPLGALIVTKFSGFCGLMPQFDHWIHDFYTPCLYRCWVHHLVYNRNTNSWLPALSRNQGMSPCFPIRNPSPNSTILTLWPTPTSTSKVHNGDNLAMRHWVYTSHVCFTVDQIWKTSGIKRYSCDLSYFVHVLLLIPVTLGALPCCSPTCWETYSLLAVRTVTDMPSCLYNSSSVTIFPKCSLSWTC